MGERGRGGRQLTDRPGPPARRLDASMSLLVELRTHAIDEGYAEAATRKAAAAATRTRGGRAEGDDPTGPDDSARTPIWPSRTTVVAAAVLALAGTLFATAAVANHRGAAVAKNDRKQLLAQVHDQTTASDELQQQLGVLRSQVAAARSGALATSTRGAALQAQIAALDAIDGGAAVQGPGVQVVLDNAPSTGNAATDALGVIFDRDLQAVANALFVCGAQAIAINGQRLTTQTAIREAGDAILVDYRALSPPYVIDAIGPRDLGTAFRASATGQLYKTWQQVYGLRFTADDQSRLTLPSAANLVVHYAKPLDTS